MRRGKIIYILLLLIMGLTLQATKLYWNPTSGTHDYNTLANWDVNAPGSGIAPIVAPLSTDSVYFIGLDTSTVSVTADISCNYLEITNPNIIFVSTQAFKWKIFDNVTIASGCKPFGTVNAYLITLSFIQLNGTKIVDLGANNLYYNRFLFEEGNVTVNSPIFYSTTLNTNQLGLTSAFLSISSGTINLNSTITFTQTTNTSNNGMAVLNGVFNINGGIVSDKKVLISLDIIGNSSLRNAFWSSSLAGGTGYGVVNINNFDCFFSRLEVRDDAQFYCHGRTIDAFQITYVPTSLGIFDVKNSVINVTFWNFKNGQYTTGYSDFTNSTLNCTDKISGVNAFLFPSAQSNLGSQVILGSYNNYNNVIINSLKSYFFFSGYGLAETNTIDSLVIKSSLSIQTAYCTINSLLSIKEGVNIASEYIGYSLIALNTGSKLEMLGTCYKRISLRNLKFDVASAIVNLPADNDYVVIDNCTATGAGIPIALDVNSYAVPGFSNTGFTTPTTPTARVLTWRGNPSAIAGNYYSYGRWSDGNSWDIGGVFPQCPPTPFDSVVFPANSLVRIDNTNATTPVSTCKTMHWLASGELYDSTAVVASVPTTSLNKLEIFGSLIMNASVQNNFNGDFYFRAWEDYPIIQTGNRQFNGNVWFDATSNNAKWTQQDSLVFNPLVQQSSLKTSHIKHISGHWYLNNQGVRAFLYHRFPYLEANFDSKLSLTNSTVIIFGTSNCFFKVTPQQFYNASFSSTIKTYVDGGTATIKFVEQTPSTLPQSYFSGGGYKYHKVWFTNTHGWLFHNHHEIGNTNIARPDTIQTVVVDKNAVMYTNNIATIGTYLKLGKLESGVADANTMLDVAATNLAPLGIIEIDSAIHYNNAKLYSPTKYNYLLKLSAGKAYIFDTTSIHEFNVVNDARVEGIGSCNTGYVYIDGAKFKKTGSSNITTLDYVIIENSNASSVSFFLPNSVDIGGNTGTFVFGTPPPPRKLRWKDTTPLASKGDWYNPNNWEQILPTYIAPPQCPPTPKDTVLFEDPSFTGNDTVAISNFQTAFFHTMKWLNTNAVTPVFSSSLNEKIQCFGSLFYSSNLNHNLNAALKLRGVATNTLDTKGKWFNNHIIFAGDIDATSWELASPLKQKQLPPPVNSVYTYLNRGHLNTKGDSLVLASFQSYDNQVRSLDITNSKVIINNSPWYGYAWGVSDPLNKMKLYSSNSFIKLTMPSYSYFAGGGKKYNDVYLTQLQSVIGNGDTIQTLTMEGSSNAFSSIGGSNMYISKLKSIGTKISADNITITVGSITPGGRTLVVDSIETSGGIAIKDSLHIRKYMGFVSNCSYEFPNNKTVYLSNICEFNIIGSPGLKVKLNTSTGGATSYIRKDSGLVCTDYSVIKDVWAIGNGGNYVLPATMHTVILNDTVLVSSLRDGLTQPAGGIPPSGAVNPAYSGRAKFMAGGNADIQSNAKGWDESPYTLQPTVALSISKDSICPGDSSIVVASLTMPLGFTAYPGYFIMHVGTNRYVQTFNDPTSPTSFTVVAKPTTGISIVKVDTMHINQCINADTIYNVIKPLVVADPPANQVLNFSGNDTVCYGTGNLVLSPTSNATPTGGNAVSYDFFSPINVNIGSDNTAPYTLPLSGTATVDTWYYVQSTNEFGCKTTIDSVLLKIVPVPVMNTLSDKVICSGDSILSNFSTTPSAPNTSFNWTAASIGGVTGYSATGTTTLALTDTLFNTQPTNQTVTYTITPQVTSQNVTCLGTPQLLTVTVTPIMTLTSSFPPIKCDLLPITNLNAYLVPSNVTGTWQGTNVSGITLTPSSSISSYTVMFTSNSVCQEAMIDSFIVTDTFRVVLSSYPATSLDLNTPYTLVTTPNGYSSYNFYINGVLTQNNSSNTLNQTATQMGDYTISVEVDNNGCIGRDTILLSVFHAPNTFTPNGDGVNDTFANGYDKQIINRWGEVIFEGIEGWNGKNKKGQIVVPGTYFYIIKKTDLDTKQVKQITGSVEVLTTR